ncbi:hypothetical protein GCM10010109_47960 [Actinoplanes campanulatus]|nr:hypothetical protein GCM10010109_47960 [Actinoplanes campanulatus]GID38928.1 hypothetical protein Aca09nite_54340 [Actinoplanes campanulatus]
MSCSAVGFGGVFGAAHTAPGAAPTASASATASAVAADASLLIVVPRTIRPPRPWMDMAPLNLLLVPGGGAAHGPGLQPSRTPARPHLEAG